MSILKHLFIIIFVFASYCAIAQNAVPIPELFLERINNEQTSSFNGVTYIDNPWVTLTTFESHPNQSTISNEETLEITLEVTHDSIHPTADGINIWVAFSPLQGFDFDGLESLDANCGDLAVITCQDHPNGLFAYLPYSDEDFCYSFSIPVSCFEDSVLLTVGYVVQFTANGSVIDYTYEDNILHYTLSPCSQCDAIQEPTITTNGNEVSVFSNDPSVAGFDVGYILDGDTTYFITGTNPVLFSIPTGVEVEIVVMSYLPGPGGDGVTCYYSELAIGENSTLITTPVTEKILILPNPTCGSITIDGPATMKEIYVYDVLGRLLYHGSYQKNLNLSTWGRGLRLVTISGESNATSFKVLVD